ncbi:MAG: formyltetrahydrofolate deformylase [Leptospiraceae bacterium]|nr:formyltetrahydrofolate deformylase [Leptospiraceae bacterium]
MKLLIECEDQVGLVHKITGVLFDHNLNIVSNNEFVDHTNKRFFMRTEFYDDVDTHKLKKDLFVVLQKKSIVSLFDDRPKKIIVFCSKEPHCLGDILIRNQFSQISAEVIGVISNHNDLKSLVEKFNIPFYFIDHQNISREEHELKILDLLRDKEFDYIVLAKYMRILNESFVNHYVNKIINIHHSFLPAFIGANPYKQAWDRGVKIIGATAHFVTSELDRGPIIVQNVASVSHSHSVEEMKLSGRDVEKSTLAKALNLVFEDRIFVSGNKTIIFD